MKRIKNGCWLWMVALFSACMSQHVETVYRFQSTMTVDGWTRSYLLNLPPDFYENDNFPLVIAMHGTGGNALQCERDYGLTEIANLTNYVIVYPEGIPRKGPLGIRTWNAGSCCDYAVDREVDDIQFISSLIDLMIKDFKVNPSRVYVTGMSNGAMMAYRVACELSDKIAAIAPVSGALVTSSCRPSHAIPILHIHSELDSVVPYLGGEGLGGYQFPSMDSVINIWRILNDCQSEPSLINKKELYEYVQWKHNNRVMIETYLTKDGGHSWPGGLLARPNADRPSGAIDATSLIWDFFERQR